MARVQKNGAMSMEVKQELFPGIPDHITLSNIASKLKWKACNVLQLVSQGWRHAISSRGVYDGKVHLKVTEPYLLFMFLHGHVTGHGKIVVSLYSCENGSSWQLPPIPITNIAYFNGICLAGRVFVWVTTVATARTMVMGRKDERLINGRGFWTFDLVGDRQWVRNGVNDTPVVFDYGYGVLKGNIYRFQGSTNIQGQFKPFISSQPEMPRAEIYNPPRDPRHGVWPFIAPESEDGEVSWANLEDQLTIFSRGIEEQQAVDINNANEMGTQVFYTRLVWGTSYAEDDEEHFFFSGAKLFKLIRKMSDMIKRSGRAEIQVYDTQKNKWEQWRLFSTKFPLLESDGCSWLQSTYVSANNVVWATVQKPNKDGRMTTSLVRSLECIGEKSAELLTWIDTGYSLISSGTFHAPVCDYREENVVLRPIYL